jgi:hypothetical protein
MEYIEKRDGLFYACKGEVKVDNVKIFDSRRNYKGVFGAEVCINVGNYHIEWFSNFGYGSASVGRVYINFKRIFITSIDNIWTTQEFVDILNDYSDPNNIDKDDIILELANKTAHYRKILREPAWKYFGNSAKYTEPVIGFNGLPWDSDRALMENVMREGRTIKKAEIN